jgi:hypothetical protein
MDLGSLIALLKLAQDVQEPPAGKLYTKEKALYRAESGLGL